MTYYTKLSNEEFKTRFNRLAQLICMFEDYPEGPGHTIHQKALKAYNKTNGFTGIIRLTFTEKDFLSYKLEDQFIDKEEIELIRFYCKINDETWEEILQYDDNLRKVWEEEQ